MLEREFGSVILGGFGGFEEHRRVKQMAIDRDGGLEARVMIGSVFHRRVLWRTPLLLVAKLLQLRLVHSFKPSLLFSSLSL